MSSSLKFDSGSFDRALKEVTQQALRRSAEDATRVLDGVHRRVAGKPVAVVMVELRSATRRVGWTITDAELRPYAEAIAQGRKIRVEPER